ncbi:hypothetical protein CCM_08186 [Cordyceps militaris CM01]|uniref:Uncharacterized protein n=1 Tax=Cordyceps militaris (strain CM01) TaxID=983644 RepID=G3JNU3_CORMM|nr:uncharacterized protein CCM_08186 [Cordyceps militaris CM01]EGX89933.1 hypothetical protein CCM_08186 [Cordyceps militaris CM01]
MTDLDHFPNLDQAEFTEACHLLDSRYRQAILGPLRRRWKLNVFTALDMSFSDDNEGYIAYVQIVRPLEDEIDLPFDLGAFSISGNATEHLTSTQDAEMMETEESDTQVIPTQNADPDIGCVIYEIHFHPTYRVPCLWFTLHGLPESEPAFHIDTVFRRLVPESLKASLRAGMGIGAISTDVRINSLELHKTPTS